MQVQDIPTLPVKPYMDDDVQSLRKNAPLYIKSIIEDTFAVKEVKSLKELGSKSISPLSGGMLSAVYFLQSKEKSIVIKLRFAGIKAEAEALKAWRKQGTNVTQVEAIGIVPQTKKKKHKVKYLILESVRDKQGNLAPTAFSYAEKHQKSVKNIGMLLGIELAKMHRAKTSRTFGEYADMWGKNNAPIKTWNAYVLGYLDVHWDHLLEEGVTKSTLKKVCENIKRMKFPKRGVFVHGDYSMRNAMIVSQKPLQIKIFDPNPLIGDPSWDLAVLYNNEEFERRKYEFNPRKKSFAESYQREKDCLTGFIEGYEQTTKKKINLDFVRVSQLMQTLFLLQIEENKAKKAGEEPSENVEVMVRKDSLLEKIEWIANKS